MTATERTEPSEMAEPRPGSADVHETSGPAVLGDTSSFPSHAELARTLVEPGGLARVSTLTASGHPYGSIAPYSAHADGAPLICVSSLAVHTQNLRRDPRASVLIEALPTDGGDPLADPRVTLVGTFVPCVPSAGDVDAHLSMHPFASNYINFADFSWWRLDILEVRHVGGFGVMGWSTADEYATATADPVIPYATPMIEHLDADHADACVSIVRHLAGVVDAVAAPLAAIDRYGMTFDARNAAGRYVATARVAFPEPLTSADQVRTASIELVRRAQVAIDS